MSAEKRKGDAFEREVVRVLNEHGHPYAERALQLGRHDDRGDIAGIPGFYLDAKNHARLQLATWVDEARAEVLALNRDAIARLGLFHHNVVHPLVPVVVVKRRGKGAEHAYAVLELATFAEVIRDA
jgi:Holliday junction resolvase